jgi:hypothetical protein
MLGSLPPIWKIVPQSLTQIPFFYPPPGVSSYQVIATLTLPNMVISIPVWYLKPPSMVPTPSLPVQPTIGPTTPIIQTQQLPIGHTVAPTTTNKGGNKKKKGTNQPRVQPPCMLCATVGHLTNLFPTFPELHNLIQLPKAAPLLPTPTVAPTPMNPLP